MNVAFRHHFLQMNTDLNPRAQRAESLYSQSIIIACRSDLDDNLESIPVDSCHRPNSTITLFLIPLIDADGVNLHYTKVVPSTVGSARLQQDSE